MQEIKVLHLIDNLGLGGAQRVVQTIFQSENTENFFLFSLRQTPIKIHLSGKNIFQNNSSSRYSFPLFKIKKFIQQEHITHLHCHLAKSQIMGYFLKRFFFPNLKLVLHEHGEIFENGKIYPFLMNFFRKKVDFYIAVSNSCKQKIIEKTNYNSQKISVLYNAISEEKFFSLSKKEKNLICKTFGLQKKSIKIGFASRLIHEKGWEDFLQATEILRKKIPNLEICIAGDGPDREKIIALREKSKHTKTIHLLGYISDMNALYNILDVFVFPSYNEAAGLTGIEANASGCPVVASNIPGLSELMIHKKNALIFPVGNTKALKKAIQEMVEDTILRKNLIKNGKNIAKKYSAQLYIQSLFSLYKTQ